MQYDDETEPMDVDSDDGTYSPAAALTIHDLPPEILYEIARQRPEEAPVLARVGGLMRAPGRHAISELAHARQARASAFECTANPTECVLTWPGPNFYVGIQGGARAWKKPWIFVAVTQKADGSLVATNVPDATVQPYWNSVVWNCSCLPLSFDVPASIFPGYDVVFHFRPTYPQGHLYTMAELCDIIHKYVQKPFSTEQKQYIVSVVYTAWNEFLRQRQRSSSSMAAAAPVQWPGGESVPTSFKEAFKRWFNQSVFRKIVFATIASPEEFINFSSPLDQTRIQVLLPAAIFKPVQQYDTNRHQTWIVLEPFPTDVETLNLGGQHRYHVGPARGIVDANI